jgi:hypothetical protein
MKKFFVVITLMFITIIGITQQNLVTVSGGYSIANIEDTDLSASGWRINGLYEFNPMEGKVAYGFSMGYISLKAQQESNVTDTAEYKISTIPFYFVPKYMIGNKKIKGFLKGALGFQRSNFERTGTAFVLEGNDWGFYGGLGAGAMFFINDLIFINVEYEFSWMSNSYYKDGMIHSAMGGIGFKF